MPAAEVPQSFEYEQIVVNQSLKRISLSSSECGEGECGQRADNAGNIEDVLIDELADILTLFDINLHQEIEFPTRGIKLGDDLALEQGIGHLIGLARSALQLQKNRLHHSSPFAGPSGIDRTGAPKHRCGGEIKAAPSIRGSDVAINNAIVVLAAGELYGLRNCDIFIPFVKTIWERPVKSGADGATAPETLRQKDQKVLNIWRVASGILTDAAPTEGEKPNPVVRLERR